MFRQLLKDAIFRYKKSLLLTFEDQSLYITSFFQRVGWGQPKEEEIRELAKFTDNYLTLGSYLGMMSEEWKFLEMQSEVFYYNFLRGYKEGIKKNGIYAIGLELL